MLWVNIVEKVSLRFLISATSILLVLCVAFFGNKIWPLQVQKINPEITPFVGEQQMNGYTIYTNLLTNASGRFRIHKLILIVIALIVLIGGFCPLTFKKQLFHIPKIGLHSSWLNHPLFFWLVLVLAMLPFAKSLGKVADFSQRDDAHMALVNMHFAFIVGHSDKLSDGDKLFESISPKYGMLITLFVAGVEKARGGLVSLGDLLKVVHYSDFFYILLAAYGYWKWSGKRMLYILAPMLFLMHWYYSSTQMMVPMNHSPIRTAGITVSLVTLLLMRKVSINWLGFTCGSLAAFSILNNVESGIAATVGLLAFVFLRVNSVTKNIRKYFQPFGMLILGFLVVWCIFSFACYCILGVFFGISGLAEYVYPAFKGASGAWATNDPITFWPVFMFIHVSLVVVYSAWNSRISFKDAYRCALGVMFLVWFAYFVNRPEPAYLCSYYFMYGFLVIDLEKALLKKNKKPILLGSALALGIIGFQLQGVVQWSLKPWKWQLSTNPLKWGVPVVRVGQPLAADAIDMGNAYISKGYHRSLSQRGEFLKKRSLEISSKRLVYFTVDSYLMPRFSNILPWQEYPDPLEAMNRQYYERLIRNVVQSPFNEIYFDARDEKSLVWYGGMFQMVRRDLGEHFQKVGVESGWEIWKRISKN